MMHMLMKFGYGGCVRKSSMLAWCLKYVDDEKYNVNDHVRDKVRSTWLIMLSAMLEWPLPIWTLYECVILDMLRVVYSNVGCTFVFMIKCSVWSRIPKMLYMWVVHDLWNIVIVLWSFKGMFSSIQMWLILCHYKDQYVHTRHA